MEIPERTVCKISFTTAMHTSKHLEASYFKNILLGKIGGEDKGSGLPS
jgi:hypothetical protein